MGLYSIITATIHIILLIRKGVNNDRNFEYNSEENEKE